MIREGQATTRLAFKRLQVAAGFSLDAVVGFTRADDGYPSVHGVLRGVFCAMRDYPTMAKYTHFGGKANVFNGSKSEVVREDIQRHLELRAVHRRIQAVPAESIAQGAAPDGYVIYGRP